MEENGPQFDSAEHAIAVAWRFLHRLTRLLIWTLLGLAHVLALQALLLYLWWAKVDPATVQFAFLAWVQSTSAAVLGAAGVSATTLLGGYLWLMRRLLVAASGSLIGRLLGPPSA